MKKFIVLCSAGLLILAFSAAGYAQAPKLDFRASGSIDAQTHWSMNVPPLNGGAVPIYGPPSTGEYSTFRPIPGGQYPTRALNHTAGYWDSRMSLRFEAAMGKELSAVLQFEIDSTNWGNSQGQIRPGSEAHSVGKWSTDQTAIEVKYMYMDVGLPYIGIPVPINVRLGAQPMAIRPAIFAATDGMGVSAAIKIDPVTINPFYFKPGEGFYWVADDVDIWGLQVNAKLGTLTVGGYGAYYDMQQYPLGQQPFSPAPGAVNYVAGTSVASLFWLGVYTDGKVGPVDLNFDAAYDFGHVTPRSGNNYSKVAYSGWVSRLKVDYPFEKFNFGTVAMYASGSDANKTSSNGLPGSTAANGGESTRVGGYMVPVGSESGAANNESAVFYGMEPGASGGQGWAANHSYSQASKGAFGGTYFAKLYGSYKITPWYKITLQGLYIGDTASNGNTYGNARRYVGATGAAAGYLRDDSFIGVELDLLNEIQIYKNLVFKVFGGYLWAGNAMDMYSGSTVTGNFAMKNPWAIRTRLLYTF
ncbi:MAG: hypothetical protein MUP41_01650 [Desulfobacterales bacterium]|nr:hypothetical protein [Desulfobacterales bacterium]